MPEKETSVLRTRVCKQCGAEFVGGPRAWYCPDCRYERQREQARRFREKKANGLVERPLGSIDHCEVCGAEYVVQSARQRYCKKCAPERVREVDRQQGRGWLKRAIEKHGEQYHENNIAKKREAWHRENAKQTVCPMCGEVVPAGERKFCCDKCRNAAQRYACRKYSYKVGRQKEEPNFADYQKGGRLYDKKR